MPPHDGSGGALVSGTSRCFIYDGHQNTKLLKLALKALSHISTAEPVCKKWMHAQVQSGKGMDEAYNF
ncbi:hypothetical protein GX48_02319 [Paracoccidioides brasiliensis]|nr:hypothetical protein GX48_02319 [Paracoccidioides brasiliensis]